MSAIIRACAILARSFDSGSGHAGLGIPHQDALEASVAARSEYDQLRNGLGRVVQQNGELQSQLDASIGLLEAILPPSAPAPEAVAEQLAHHPTPAERLIARNAELHCEKTAAEAQLAAVRAAVEEYRTLMGCAFGEDIALYGAAGLQAVMRALTQPPGAGTAKLARRGGANG